MVAGIVNWPSTGIDGADCQVHRSVMWRTLWEWALTHLISSDNGQPCLKLYFWSLQKCLQDSSRLLWVHRHEAEVDHAARCRLAMPVDQLPEVSIKRKKVPVLRLCQGEHCPIGRAGHVLRYRSNRVTCCPEADD
jgi:hypothetical protein